MGIFGSTHTHTCVIPVPMLVGTGIMRIYPWVPGRHMASPLPHQPPPQLQLPTPTWMTTTATATTAAAVNADGEGERQ